LTVPSSILIAFFSYPLTSLIYQHGRFGPADTLAVSQALILYTLGIPFISALRNVASVFYAHQDSKAPMYASFISIGVNLALNLALMKPVGFLAFPLSASLASIVNIAVLIRWLPGKIGNLELRSIYNYFLKLALVSGLAGAIGYAGFKISASHFGYSFFPVLIATIILGSLSLGVFYAGCRLLKIKEVDTFIRRFLKK